MRSFVCALLVAPLCLLAIWFAPAIVAHTPLFDRLLASFTSNLQGTVQAESASLGWSSLPALKR